MKLFTIIGTPSSSLSRNASAAVTAGQALGASPAAQQAGAQAGAHLDALNSTVLAVGIRPAYPMTVDPRPLAGDGVPSPPYERSP